MFKERQNQRDRSCSILVSETGMQVEEWIINACRGASVGGGNSPCLDGAQSYTTVYLFKRVDLLWVNILQ